MSQPGRAYPRPAASAFDRPETVDDPYDYYRTLRAAGSITHDAALGAWLVSRHADVVTALRDPRFTVRPNGGFVDRLPPRSAAEFEPLRRFFATRLSFSDGPEHARWRAPWTGALSPRAVAKLRPAIEEVAEHLVGKALILGGCEVLSDFAPLSALVLSRFLGLDHEQLRGFWPWIEDVGRFMTTPTVDNARRAQESVDRWRAWTLEFLSGGGARPEGALRALSAADNGLSDEELFALVAGLVTGPASRRTGQNEPTVQFLAKALHLLLAHPDALARLRREPELVPAAVDELLRLEPPFHFVTRHAAEPIGFGGQRIEAGQRVLLLLASANRDPASFDRPDELVLDRRDSGHVAFGFGAHFCLGAPLARAEIEVTLEVILRRLQSIRRTGPVRWRMEGGFRALEGLSLSFAADDAALHALLDQVEALPPESVALALSDGGPEHE